MTLLRIKENFIKTLKSFKQIIPMILGVIMLVALFITVVPKDFYNVIFVGNKIIDPLLGATLGSVAIGQPVTSYIIGGELLNHGVSLIAVIAFILSWVTVGVFQLPAEALVFGKKFAMTRNLLSFVSALAIAVLTTLTLSFL
ncbi:MAG: hypothetical protein U9Q96_01030 [Patescibacteria group bacterium]|nr:hypothetical protein [Patescibacteria group bacterium]